MAWLIHLSTLVRESVLSFLQPFLVQTKIKKMTPPPFTACAKMHKWHKPHFAPDARKDKFKLSLLTVKCNFNCLLSEKVSKHLYSQKIYPNKAFHFFCQRKLIDMRKLPVLFIDGVHTVSFLQPKFCFFSQHSLSLGSRNELKTSRLNIFETSDVKGKFD